MQLNGENVRPAAEQALEFVQEGMIVGLGSGHAAETFLRLLADRVALGLRVQGVSTSRRTTELAAAVDVSVISLEAAGKIDVLIDGADRVDPKLDLPFPALSRRAFHRHGRRRSHSGWR